MTAVIHKTSVGAGGKHTLSPEESLRQSVSLIWETTLTIDRVGIRMPLRRQSQRQQRTHTVITGVGSGGARGAAAPLNAVRRGLRPPTNWCEWVSETKCEIKQPAVVHSGMAQKRIESFFAPAPRRTATVVS